MRPEKLNIDLGEAEGWARKHFGLVASTSELPGDIDRNVLLTGEDGRRWVLKLASDATHPVEIECQHAALQCLEITDLRHLVPRLVPNLGGEFATAVLTVAGDSGILRLVTYLPGRPLASLEQIHGGLRHEIGHTLANLDLRLASFDHPGAHRHLTWDLKNVLELHPHLDTVACDLRALVAAGLDAFESKVLPRLGELPSSIIHNDANDYNLLVEGNDNQAKLCGVIDFGDIVHTITVAELAVACTYAMFDAPDPRLVGADIIAGYESARPLTDLERDLLPELIVARLCTSLIMSARARVIAPDDEYLHVSERPAADLLERLSP